MLHRKKKPRKPVTDAEISAAWHKAYGIFYCKQCGCNYTHWCPTHGGPETTAVLKEFVEDD